MKKLRKTQTGFSLIELMIVIGIIGILAVAALPAYQNYVARAQVAEGIMLAGSMKSYVEEAYADKGSLPLDLNIKQLASDDNKVGNYVKIVRIEDNGTIVAAIGNQAAVPVKNTEIHLTPSLQKQVVLKVQQFGLAVVPWIHTSFLCPANKACKSQNTKIHCEENTPNKAKYKRGKRIKAKEQNSPKQGH